MELNLSEKLSNAIWHLAVNVERPFVRHPNTQNSPGLIWYEKHKSSDSPIISIIIPTFDAYRDGYFLKLLRQIGLQTFYSFEVVAVRGDPRQGRAINLGAALAKGKYLLTLDDDSALPDPETFRKLVAVMEANLEIGIAGGNNVIPEDASPFVRRVMEQVPRYSWKPVQKITDSDLAQHGCMIIRTKDFKMVGGENELIPRGLDPYLREEFRKMGKRVVLVPEVIYHHLPPNSIRKLVFRLYRNGRQAAFANRNYPQWIIETPPDHGPFRNRLPLRLRIFRFPLRLLWALITGKPIWFLCEVAYALGFVHELIFSKKIS